MYELDENEKLLINTMKMVNGRHTEPDDKVKMFVDSYEDDPDHFTGRNSYVRYIISKKGFTMGELEVALNLKANSISNAAQSRQPKVDAYLSALFDVPIAELRPIKVRGRKSRKASIKDIAQTLRHLATQLETLK